MVITVSGQDGENVIAITILEEIGHAWALKTEDSVMDTHRKWRNAVRMYFKKNIWQGWVNSEPPEKKIKET